MSFFSVLKGMRWTYLLKVGLFSIRHPFFAFATFRATSTTYRITQSTFPDVHGRENSANAFRHALWNMMILNYSLGFTSNLDKAVLWTKNITDMHEELAPNRLLSKKMDLKNNELGRVWFLENKFKTQTDMINFLLLKTKEAVQVNQISEIDKATQLVYLEV